MTPLNLELLSDSAKAALLARLAHTLTICARDTYEVGTENVLDCRTLRGYNELLHQVTGSAVSPLSRSEAILLNPSFKGFARSASITAEREKWNGLCSSLLNL
jgi:hypothetical protein